MLTIDIMRHLRGVWSLVVLVLAMLAVTPSGIAGTAYAPAIDTPTQHSTPFLRDLVPLSVADSGLQSSSTLLTIAENSEVSGVPNGAVSASDDSKDTPLELGGVVRHRGYVKFLFLVLLCGAIVRFLSSPTFLDFITDALDPRAW